MRTVIRDWGNNKLSELKYINTKEKRELVLDAYLLLFESVQMFPQLVQLFLRWYGVLVAESKCRLLQPVEEVFLLASQPAKLLLARRSYFLQPLHERSHLVFLLHHCTAFGLCWEVDQRGHHDQQACRKTIEVQLQTRTLSTACASKFRQLLLQSTNAWCGGFKYSMPVNNSWSHLSEHI